VIKADAAEWAAENNFAAHSARHGGSDRSAINRERDSALPCGDRLKRNFHGLECSSFVLLNTRHMATMGGDMSRQYSFDYIDKDAPQKQCDRLFCCIVPDPITAMLIEQRARSFHRNQGLARVIQSPVRQHISIWHIGDYGHLREMDIEASRQAFARIFMREFDVTLNGFESFNNRRISRDGRPHRPLVVKAEGEGFYELSMQVCHGLGLKSVPKQEYFKPHLTVSYGPELIEYQQMPPISFRAHELLLIHSEVGLSRYHVLHRRPFLVRDLIDNKQ